MTAEPDGGAPSPGMPPPALYAEFPEAAPPLGLPGRVDDIVAGPLRRAIFRLALPAVGTTLFQVLFNITDTFWVGRMLGADALAGVSVASYSIWILTSIGELVGVGLTAVASRRQGERNPRAAARAAGTALVLAAAIGLAVAAGGIASLDALFRLMGTTGKVGEFARQFLAVQLLGAGLIYGYFVVTAAFRSAGDTRTPFVLLGAAVLLNLVLDPLMIMGWGPVPALGVYGAALATVLTRGLSFVVGLWLLARRRGIVLGFELPVARAIARIGLPTMLTGVLFSLIYILLVRVTSSFGTAALAALGVGHRIEGISYMVCIGFALAAETIVGQNLGAGKRGRARTAGWMTARMAAVPTTCFGVLFLLVPEQLASIFSTDAAVIAAAALYLRAVAVAQLVIAFEVVIEGALSGAGYTFWTMVCVVTISAVRVPLAPLAAAYFGLAGIWWMLSLTAIARAAALSSLWRWGRWERTKA
jgi:putative MATE family efflux protein